MPPGPSDAVRVGWGEPESALLSKTVCLALSLLSLSSCLQAQENRPVPWQSRAGEMVKAQARNGTGHLNTNDTIGDILNHPAFAGFGRLILPWDDRTYLEPPPAEPQAPEQKK